jgi:hypothetical protein
VKWHARYPELSLQVSAALPLQASGVVAPAEPRKSLHKQSFLQQSVPFTNGIPHVNPVEHRVSRALAKSRVCPLQSLSSLHSALQKAVVLTGVEAPAWTAGLRQMRLGQSSAWGL